MVYYCGMKDEIIHKEHVKAQIERIRERLNQQIELLKQAEKALDIARSKLTKAIQDVRDSEF